MHPNVMVELEGMAIGLARQGARRGRADVGEEERRRDLSCKSLQVQVIPCWGDTNQKIISVSRRRAMSLRDRRT